MCIRNTRVCIACRKHCRQSGEKHCRQRPKYRKYVCNSIRHPLLLEFYHVHGVVFEGDHIGSPRYVLQESTLPKVIPGAQR